MFSIFAGVIVGLICIYYLLSNRSKNVNGKQLKPIPRFSILKATAWLMLYGQGRFTQLLLYLGKMDKVVETGYSGFRVAFINDIHLAKDAFKKFNICGRPPSPVLDCYTKGPHGVLNTTGKPWEENRKFTTQQMRQFGLNTKAMEENIQAEIDDLLHIWSEKKGKTFSPNKTFYIPIVSSLWLLMAGERTSSTNKKVVDIVCKMFEAVAKVAVFPELLIMFSPMSSKSLNRLVTLIPIFPGTVQFQEIAAKFVDYIGDTITSKKSTIKNVNETPTDLMAAYFKEIEKTTDLESDFFGKRGEQNLTAVTFDFFTAGGDTTSSMIAWSFLHLIRNPRVQENIKKEIDKVVGVNRRPLLSDRPSCPYTIAFISEVLRYNPFAAATFPHQTTEDSSIGPYFIKKDTTVFLNIYNIHHDPEIWGDPKNFRPERFLSADEKTYVKHEALCGFSVGLRRCPGEQFALDNLFLFVSSICQRFILKPDPKLNELPKLREVKSLFNSPDLYNIVALERA